MYFINPQITIRIDDVVHDAISLGVGAGDKRENLLLQNGRIVTWLLDFIHSADLDEIVLSAERFFSINKESALQLVESLIKSQVLVTHCQIDNDSMVQAKKWESWGWRDALDFHLACYDLTFNPDRKDYLEAMNSYIEAVDTGDEQPSPGAYKEDYENSQHIVLPDSSIPNVSAFDVFMKRELFFGYSGEGISVAQLSSLLKNTYGIQYETNGLLGKQIRRSSPSGGARHPIEAYVVINNVDGAPQGLYHYHPKHNRLESMREGELREEINEVCFQKTGIRTASAIIILTARWFRHIWKYRYSRSYRMVLLDAGHLVQTNVLTGCAVGLRSYLCPSIHDSLCSKFLNLPEDCEEGPLFAIGIGPY